MNGRTGRGDRGIGSRFSTEGDIVFIFCHCFRTNGHAVFTRGLAIIVTGITVEILNPFGIHGVESIANVIDRAGCPIGIIDPIARGTDFS